MTNNPYGPLNEKGSSGNSESEIGSGAQPHEILLGQGETGTANCLVRHELSYDLNNNRDF